MARVSRKASIPHLSYSRPTPEYLSPPPGRLRIVAPAPCSAFQSARFRRHASLARQASRFVTSGGAGRALRRAQISAAIWTSSALLLACRSLVIRAPGRCRPLLRHGVAFWIPNTKWTCGRRSSSVLHRQGGVRRGCGTDRRFRSRGLTPNSHMRPARSRTKVADHTRSLGS